MKRFLAALFMYLRIGVGASMVLIGFAKAVYLSTNPKSGDEALIVFCIAVGLPLLIAGAARLGGRPAT
jgi:hypothetical protein